MHPDDLDYYAGQGAVTDPGRAPHQLTGIDRHRRPAPRGAARHPLPGRGPGRRDPGGADGGIDSRHADDARPPAAVADQPLTEQRSRERLVGCVATSPCSSWRWPARWPSPPGRVGFGSYCPRLQARPRAAEDSAENCWRLLDANIGDGYRDPNDGAAIDRWTCPRPLPGRRRAWQRRATRTTRPLFVVSPQLELSDTRGRICANLGTTWPP